MKKLMIAAALVLTSASAWATDAALECQADDLRISGVYIPSSDAPVLVHVIKTVNGKDEDSVDADVATYWQKGMELRMTLTVEGLTSPYVLQAMFDSTANGYRGRLSRQVSLVSPSLNYDSRVFCQILVD